MKKVTPFILFFLALLLVMVTINTHDAVLKKSTERVEIGKTSFFVEVADRPKLRERGLSGRTYLAQNRGMFFVFDAPERYGFWMKDMSFPIDIIWIDQNWKIVHIENSVSPKTYPTVFVPETPAQYVLEVNAGWSQSLGIKVGDTIEFFRQMSLKV